MRVRIKPAVGSRNNLTFYLGTHQPGWLSVLDDVPLFISRRRLLKFKTLPVATTDWVLDSGAFSEISKHRQWQCSALSYAREARRYMEEIGRLQWAAPQDWMCEPNMMQLTGLNVSKHQALSTFNYETLCMLDPDVPWRPVLQGWKPEDYFRHVDFYLARGIDLTKAPVVGIGSVCRREHTTEVEQVIAKLARAGIRLHGFGMKRRGVRNCGNNLVSADSMAWSFRARRRPPLPNHEHRHKTCANCIAFALLWRRQVLEALREGPEDARNRTTQRRIGFNDRLSDGFGERL